MTATVVLDGAFLCLETPSSDQDDVIKNIMSLQEWASAPVDVLARCAVSAKTVEDLHALGCFPSVDYIKSLLRKYSLTGVYTAADIAEGIAILLSRVPYLEDKVAINDLLFSDEEFDPNPRANAIDPTIAASTERAIAVLCLDMALRTHRRELNHICTIPPPTELADGFSVRFCLDVADPEIENWELPKPVAERIGAVSTPSSFLTRLDARRLWIAAENASHIKFAIQRETDRRCAIHNTTPLKVTVGPDFYKSLIENQAAAEGRFATAALDHCAQIASQTNSFPINDLRTGTGAGAPVRIRKKDKATAQRVHLSKAGVGLRLMFWKLPDGSIEFANVGPKQELWISENDPGDAI